MEEVLEETVKNVYDPSKKYTWDPADKFELSGEEFGLYLNTLRLLLNTEAARTIILASKASESVEAIMAKSVEAGIVKEIQE